MTTGRDNVTLIGMPGAGKSTVGVVLAKILGKDFIDTDLLIQAEHGRTLQKIIDAKMHPGIAINPGTSVEQVKMLLRIVKKVLVMSVNPGNAAQIFLPYVREKYDELLVLKEDMDFDIYWDGACGADKIKEYAPLGVKGFVLGTTLLSERENPTARHWNT